MLRAAAVLGLALAVSACGMFRSKSESLRHDIVATALDQVGKDYHYGGNTPHEGFDCSGLVQYSYAEHGIKLPRTAAEQRRVGKGIPLDQARPGDLLFYNFAGVKPNGWHVVMYVGDGQGVHAPTHDGEVEVIKVTEKHWRERFVGVARLIRDD
jgi:cell wall-associated NlpC family hydrolase